MPFVFYEDITGWLEDNDQHKNLPVIALEQSNRSTMLPDFRPPEKFALLLGEEVHGITPVAFRTMPAPSWKSPCPDKKNRLNVSVAAGIALYGLTVRK